jgi:hypothetical protein
METRTINLTPEKSNTIKSVAYLIKTKRKTKDQVKEGTIEAIGRVFVLLQDDS